MPKNNLQIPIKLHILLGKITLKVKKKNKQNFNGRRLREQKVSRILLFEQNLRKKFRDFFDNFFFNGNNFREWLGKMNMQSFKIFNACSGAFKAAYIGKMIYKSFQRICLIIWKIWKKSMSIKMKLRTIVGK